MTYCSKLFEGLDKRLSKKMNIDEIAIELCPDVGDRRRKIIRILNEHKGKKFLSDNADWLGYQVQEKGSKILTPLPKEEIEIPKEEPPKEEIEIPKEEIEIPKEEPIEPVKDITLLYFFTKSCGSCHHQKLIIEELQKEYKDKIDVSFIDCDENVDTAKAYGIKSIPTMVFRKTLGRRTGLTCKSDLAKIIEDAEEKVTAPNGDITVVCISADLCDACQTFEPTFKALKKIYKSQKNIKFYSIKQMENEDDKLVYEPAELTADEKRMLYKHLAKCESVPYLTINDKYIDDAFKLDVDDIKKIISRIEV